MIEADLPRSLAKTTLPIPRLHHCLIGITIRLAGEHRVRTIVAVDSHYAYFEDGKASLCCEVAEEFMMFGDGSGWRPRLIPNLCGKPYG